MVYVYKEYLGKQTNVTVLSIYRNKCFRKAYGYLIKSAHMTSV